MRKLLIYLAALALALSACSSGSGTSTDADEDPKGALVEAMQNLAEDDGLTVETSLQSDAASLQALAEDDGSELTDEQIDKILGSSITLSGTQGETLEDSASSVVVNVAGTDAIELRQVELAAYFRVDVDTLLEAFEQDPAELQQVAASVQGQPGFEWVQPALQGEWLVVKDLDELTQQMGANPAPDQKKFTDDLLNIVEENATVTSEGDDEAGTHLVAALPLRQTAEDLEALFGGMAALPPGMDMTEALQDIPEGDLNVDFWIQGGTVSQVELDFLQFAKFEEEGEGIPEGVDELGIRVTIDEFTGTIETVDDAIEIDPLAIAQAFSGMTGATGVPGAPGAPAFDCSQLKGAPPEVIALYAEECPGLQK